MKKTISLLICIMLILSACRPVFAAEESRDGIIHEEAERVAEIVELREKNSDTYLLSDGSYECVVYSENKYYENADGKLAEIDNSIIRTDYRSGGAYYKYANAANSTKVYFSETQPGILIESGNKELAFSIVNPKKVMGMIGNKANEYYFQDFDFSANNCITYTDIFDSTDIVYSVGTGYLKEYIILKDKKAPSAFQFEFDTRDCYIKEGSNKTLNVYGLKGELLFEFAPLFAVDSAGNYTEKLKYEIVKASEVSTIVSVCIDEEYLTSDDRVFPVLIDPSVMVTGEWCTYDTYVSSRYPNTNYYLQNWLRTGRDSDFYIRRTYISFDLPSSITSTGITSAYIEIKKYSGSVPAVRAYRAIGNWSSSTLTWNNKPGYTTTNGSAVASLYYDDWYRLYVTNIVKGWYAGTYNNYGFVLKDATESGTSQWTTFYSSDAASPNKPELHIKYTYYGTRPYQSTSRRNINCMGYALAYAEFIGWNELALSESDMIGKNTAQLQAYIANKAEAWMRNNIGQSDFGVIGAYNSGINTGWYRVILRVGLLDLNGNGVYNIGEDFDYHWWYQTRNGNWAHKPGRTPSIYMSNTYNVNPANLTWSNGSFYYDSTGKFYQVKYVDRGIAW